LRQDAHADVAEVVGALGKQFVAQRGQAVGVRRDGPLPREWCALPLGDQRFDDIEQVRIGEEFFVRREDRGLGRLSLGVQLCAQRRELTFRRRDRRDEPASLGFDAFADLLHFDLGVADLEYFSHCQSGRRRDAEQHVGIGRLPPWRWGSGRRRDRRRRGRRRRRAALITTTLCEYRGELLHRGGGIGPLATIWIFVP
jgi:hypothetical protein